MQLQPQLDRGPIWDFLRRNFGVILFLIIAFSGLYYVYSFFNPENDRSASAISLSGAGTQLSAPITKPISSRVVSQRFAQTPPPINIAIIVGHRESDSGAVCPDGLTELAINNAIAEKVALQLANQDILVSLFSEFDPRLEGYDGLALISIHADSCGDYGPTATGFKTAGTSHADSSHLKNCVESSYGAATGLSIHENTITSHMTNYHAFNRIAPGVPALILEAGFMNLDRNLLTVESDKPANGIVNGIICFLNQ